MTVSSLGNFNGWVQLPGSPNDVPSGSSLMPTFFRVDTGAAGFGGEERNSMAAAFRL